ncbi:MAG: pyridoxamine 5'-phosphate oxidase family protein, partial [Stellaceae bacterium]
MAGAAALWCRPRGTVTIPFPQPFQEFARIFADAKAKEPSEPEAATLATATRDGRPSARMVLVKAADERG